MQPHLGNIGYFHFPFQAVGIRHRDFEFLNLSSQCPLYMATELHVRLFAQNFTNRPANNFLDGVGQLFLGAFVDEFVALIHPHMDDRAG